jgi:hypothetical protein
MAKYLVDTSILVDHLRGHRLLNDVLNSESDYFISYVTAAELVHGVRNKSELEVVKSLIEQFQLDWGSETINSRALELTVGYFLSNSLQINDALIAATAIEGDLALITTNTKHFDFIDGLNLA